MGALDWTIVGVYMLGLIAMSVVVGRGQESAEDYFVGGRAMPWWAVGISTMATQTSVISFMSIPAFVALKEGGGLTWLQYELAVPLAMIAVMVVLIPFFRKLELVSVYEYLELRFSPAVRRLISLVFLISRGFGTGIGVYSTALVLRVATGLPLWQIILTVGVLTVIYDTIGGIKAVIWSDVIQMFVLVAGVVICIYYALDAAGGLDAALDAVPGERRRALANNLGVSGEPVSFWAFLIGGFFLYVSYYGTDQSQTQRALSASTTADTKRSLIFNGLCRFPLTILYLGLGIALAGAYVASSELQGALAGRKADDLVPLFVITMLPTGIKAVIIAAMLAAAMSSLDSALNSLSASTVKDFVDPGGTRSTGELLKISKITTVLWGVGITGLAFLVGSIADTVIEAINKVGSAFYGPILASFAVGVLSRSARAQGVIVGVLAGVAVNIVFWLWIPSVHFLWWNFIGFAVTAGLAQLVSTGPVASEILERYTLRRAQIAEEERAWLPSYGILVGFFVFILAVGIALNQWA